MPKANLKKQKQARELRRAGLSIRKIAEIIKASKGSVSLWVRDIKLTNEQEKELSANKSLGQRKGLKKANSLKIENAKKQKEKNTKIGIDLISDLSKRDLLIAGAALYWGEGSKTRGDFSIVNSDYKLINLSIKWFKELNISKDMLKFKLQIPETFNSSKCLKYWSESLNINKDLIKVYKTKTKSKRIRDGYFGTIKVGIYSTKHHDIVMGMIKSLK